MISAIKKNIKSSPLSVISMLIGLGLTITSIVSPRKVASVALRGGETLISTNHIAWSIASLGIVIMSISLLVTSSHT